MTSTTCAHCHDRPVADATCCTRCADTAARNLADIAALHTELLAAYARQTRYSTNAGRRGSTTPLPWDETARTAADTTLATLVAIVRVVDDQLGTPTEGPTHDACLDGSCVHLRARALPDHGTVPALAIWLSSHLEKLRHHPAAAEHYQDLADTAALLRRVAGGPVERWFAGTCSNRDDEWRIKVEVTKEAPEGATWPCSADLFADPGASRVTCRVCGYSASVKERRALLLVAASDVLATATEISRALTSLGQPVTPERIWKWKERTRLEARSVDHDGHPLYRVGDVQDLLLEARVKAAQAEVKHGVQDSA